MISLLCKAYPNGCQHKFTLRQLQLDVVLSKSQLLKQRQLCAPAVGAAESTDLQQHGGRLKFRTATNHGRSQPNVPFNIQLVQTSQL